MTGESVEFPTVDGITLRGVLHLPRAAAPVPGVVMVHGFSAVKEMGLTAFAETLVEAGTAVLVYDHRNLGASDGSPRQEINPWAQTRDLRAALTVLGARPEVDAQRLGLWGSSFAGGEVIVAAACDDRVRAVVANVPFAGLPGVDYGDPGVADSFAAIREQVLDESGSGLADAPGEALGPMPVVTEGAGEAGFLAEPESAEWFLDWGRRPQSTWRNEVTLHNAFGTEPAFDPGVCVAQVPAALLLVVATDDRVAATDVALDAYERAVAPKQLTMVKGHHFCTYGGAGLATAADAAGAFFVEHLAPPGS